MPRVDHILRERCFEAKLSYGSVALYTKSAVALETLWVVSGGQPRAHWLQRDAGGLVAGAERDDGSRVLKDGLAYRRLRLFCISQRYRARDGLDV